MNDRKVVYCVSIGSQGLFRCHYCFPAQRTNHKQPAIVTQPDPGNTLNSVQTIGKYSNLVQTDPIIYLSWLNLWYSFS